MARDLDEQQLAAMGRDHRDVLRMVESPRTAGDLRFLMTERGFTSAAVVEDLLRDLESAGLARRSSVGLWTQTDEGRAQLHAVVHWEFQVEEVRQIEGRGPAAAGVVRSGVAHVDDWFLTEDGWLGQVSSIEPHHDGDRPGALVLTADVKLAPGMVLRGHEPVV